MRRTNVAPGRGSLPGGTALRRGVRRRLDAARGDSGSGDRRGRTGRDRGMTAIEFVLLTPVLFFMIFASVQFALYFFADHVAQAAAQAGAREARAEADENPGGWRGKATSKAQGYIDQLGPQLLTSPAVKAVQSEQNMVGVEIEADVPSVFPGLNLTVHAQSQGPVERFVEEEG
ncbi:TadE family protein [Streptomyces sp. NPDC001922]|uniref:TadE family protein n=1 Tax=Streptomyces sp. NPDC001922 TaxID=3364624 RepID=UPI0036986EE3